ncbi:MAG: iron permease [Methylophaga sp.]|nr:MAG: iron permease [Methylophaga sp.]
MLINSVIIILREVLEAALIISVLLAVSQKLQLSKQWLVAALIAGLIGAAVYAINLKMVSMAFEGSGQEIINANLHLLIYGFIFFLVAILKGKPYHRLTLLAMTSCVAVASIREGSEIIIYIHGFFAIPDLFLPVIIGSIIGMGIGISVGVLFYYLIVNMSFNNGIRLVLFLLILIAGGMIIQATQLLIQADIISSQLPLWDSSSIIDERSLFGQLLYALIGYESTPTATQVYCYITSLILMTFIANRTLKRFKLSHAS